MSRVHLLILCVAAGLFAFVHGSCDIWPQPVHVSVGSSQTSSLADDFTFHSTCRSKVLYRAIRRYEKLIKSTRKVTAVVDVASGFGVKSPSFHVSVVEISVGENVADAGDSSGYSALDTDESYEVHVEKDQAVIKCDKSIYGCIRGLETFSQLIEFHHNVVPETPAKRSRNYGAFAITWMRNLFARTLPMSFGRPVDDEGAPGPSSSIYLMPSRVHISDYPRFKYRGLLIDTSRHFLPLSTIIANLDAMAWLKMNVLHWHIIDDQSFPLFVQSHPNLSAKGAYSALHVYTNDDVRRVVSEARDRGIEVVFEIDLPGHSHSWGHGERQSVVECTPKSPGTFIINPVNNAAFAIIRDVYNDVFALFNQGAGDHSEMATGSTKLIHAGGDEVRQDCWANNAEVQGFIRDKGLSGVHDVNRFFEDRLLSFLTEEHNRTVIVWQEVFTGTVLSRSQFQRFAPHLVIDVWLGDWRSMFGAITKPESGGSRALLSACWYLDHLNERFENFYSCDPHDFLPSKVGHSSSTDAFKRVLGGHASMWGENVDADNFFSRVYPRALAVAEKLWSPPLVDGLHLRADGRIRQSMGQVWRRMRRFRCALINRGIRVGPRDPGHYCPHEYEEPPLPYQHHEL